MIHPAPLAPGGHKKPPLRDEARFIRSWMEKPLIMGSVTPSGRALAQMMARPMDPASEGPILELGPGTGPVTQALVDRGIDEARLVLVEFNTAFVMLLRERFPRANVIQGDAYAVRDVLSGVVDEPLAGVVSSLPLLTKPVPQRARLLKECLELCRPGAPFAQFTYMVAPPIPLFAAEGAAARGSRVVWRNIPPARVWTYRRATEA
ncbi:class I SAM-dependent methyltransferase [Terrihabitans rhizophilus]|jgi:phosphatidylethanolamine/phosphatidyl-N-methylethanolamine N-methyltransferase|uniref:Methyltransferase domain-containing protein n=1 Tax=Terrihabitans rhizophilus TaxID=3092662 RepID=A0ABU4RJM2_9HYPH|nr:methyltransferase domain-containing protein [Terrihabitans sp. PJ23]